MHLYATLNTIAAARLHVSIESGDSESSECRVGVLRSYTHWLKQVQGFSAGTNKTICNIHLCGIDLHVGLIFRRQMFIVANCMSPSITIQFITTGNYQILGTGSRLAYSDLMWARTLYVHICTDRADSRQRWF
jgi:hypothetical protein